ncbi:MAG: VRR-NUC domain-containing protein [Clostridia bacterium]|nr:VRR-NUC domain-containing protein [Clostridia bacterium]
MPTNIRENVVESRLVAALGAFGLPVKKFVPDHANGMPDRLVLLPGERCVWVELKTTGGKLSELQRYQHAQLRKAGQRVVTLWTTQQVDRFVEELTSGPRARE